MNENVGHLTADMVREAMEKVREQGYAICAGSDQHVVHPVEMERGGLARCASCFQIVYVGEPTP